MNAESGNTGTHYGPNRILLKLPKIKLPIAKYNLLLWMQRQVIYDLSNVMSVVIVVSLMSVSPLIT